MWRAENDTWAPDAWNGAIVRDNLKVRPDVHMVQGPDHFVFLTPCSEALRAAVPPICQDPTGFDRTAFHRAFNQSGVDFWFKIGMNRFTGTNERFVPKKLAPP